MRASTPSRSPWRTGSAAAGPAVTAGAGQPVLRAQHLSKSYHSPVLRDLDLDVEQGQFVAIMGPSGSGKSTLLHCLSGMDRPDAGSVLLGGQEITSLSEKELAALRLTRFGFVFQQAHLLTTLCLLDNIVLPGFLAGLRPRPEVTARGEELMERMGIDELATSGVTEVSGGQLQRAGICRALINDPGIVFADEPTGALNSATALQILDLLGEIHASGTTLVMVTHDSQVAARADRVLVLVDGQITEALLLGRYDDLRGGLRGLGPVALTHRLGDCGRGGPLVLLVALAVPAASAAASSGLAHHVSSRKGAHRVCFRRTGRRPRCASQAGSRTSTGRARGPWCLNSATRRLPGANPATTRCSAVFAEACSRRPSGASALSRTSASRGWP